MSFNIMDLLKDQLSDQLVGQLGNAIGLDASQTSNALGGALPGLLGGLLKSSGSSSGAEAIFNAVNDQDDGLLGNLGSMLGGDSASLISTGTKVLGSLLGNNALGSLAGAVSGFSGANKSASSGLLSLAAPIILGILKKKVIGDGLNIASLASMLMGQKDNIDNAMPAAMADQLNASGFMNAIGGDVADTARETVQQVNEEGGSMMKKLLPIIGLGLLAFLAFQFFGGEKPAAPDIGSELAVDAGGLPQELGSVLANATETLSGVTDVASAEAAAPELNNLSAYLGSMSEMSADMPAPAQAAIAAVAGKGVDTLQPVIDQVMAIPGVGPVLQPAVEGLMEKLKAFAG